VRQAADLPPSEIIEHLLTSQRQEAEQRREACAKELNNLGATLGILADALTAAGHLDEALSMAELGIDIDRALGRDRNAAASLGRTANILMEQGRYQEADARYDQVLEAARRLGNRELERPFLLNQGILARRMQQYDRAVDLYKQALKQFQDENDDHGIMRTCNLLGAVEHSQGRLSEARAWYERSREIADRRGDSWELGITAHNIGIVSLQEGEAAWRRGDEATARQWLAEAKHFLHEGLRMGIDRQDRPDQAASHGQLSQVYLLMGELDQAEAHAHQAREINEGLGIIRNLPIYYNTLAQIARARSDEAQAAQWELKRNEVQAELARRDQGGAAAEASLSQHMVQAITRLAVACVHAGLGGTRLPSETESDVAQLESDAAGPLQPLGRYLRRLATGPASDAKAALTAPPAGLPEPLPQMIARLRNAVRDAAQG
jgi:tetratricopeptide (TPR) repeat protein